MTINARPSDTLRIAALACALLLVGTAAAGERPKLTDPSFMDIDQLVVSAKGRPNEEARLRGLKSYQNRNDADAVAAFERAALYADKFSQHYLSLMYLDGVGVEKDPVQAYIWSDLAAERGARPLLAIREKMWAKLTPEQQAQVEWRGAEFYAKYGDDVA